MNKIITIGRQFGSGGREFGRRLAEELGIGYYDKEIITEIAKSTSMSEEYIKSFIEGKSQKLMPITIGRSFSHLDSFQVDNPAYKQIQSIYQAQSEIICNLAEKADCVIIGRCADFILKDYDPLRVFVYADIESRVARCMAKKREGENFTEKEMRKHILNLDKDRGKYYEFYTDQKWGDKYNYDLMLNLSFKDIPRVVKRIAPWFTV